MGILNYHYKCHECNEEKYSYFEDIPSCVYCNSTNISKVYVGEERIDKFSEEGVKLISKTKEGK